MSIVCTLEPKVNLFKNSSAKNVLVLKNNNALKTTSQPTTQTSSAAAASSNIGSVDPVKSYNNNIYAKERSTFSLKK